MILVLEELLLMGLHMRQISIIHIYFFIIRKKIFNVLITIYRIILPRNEMQIATVNCPFACFPRKIDQSQQMFVASPCNGISRLSHNSTELV